MITSFKVPTRSFYSLRIQTFIWLNSRNEQKLIHDTPISWLSMIVPLEWLYNSYVKYRLSFILDDSNELTTFIWYTQGVGPLRSHSCMNYSPLDYYNLPITEDSITTLVYSLWINMINITGSWWNYILCMLLSFKVASNEMSSSIWISIFLFLQKKSQRKIKATNS